MALVDRLWAWPIKDQHFYNRAVSNENRDVFPFIFNYAGIKDTAVYESHPLSETTKKTIQF